MGYKDNLTQYGFGQLGSGYTADGSEILPPAGKVIIAITVTVDCKFEELVAEIADGVAYVGGHDVQLAANGAGSQKVPTAQLFPAGITIYGRWTKMELSQGAAVLYYGI